MSPPTDHLAQFLQAVGYRSVVGFPYLTVHIHLVVSAIVVIYAGAHASLSRPSSAGKVVKKVEEGDDDNDEDDELEGEGQTMEGLGM